jgi:hypothetical protein
MWILDLKSIWLKYLAPLGQSNKSSMQANDNCSLLLFHSRHGNQYIFLTFRPFYPQKKHAPHMVTYFVEYIFNYRGCSIFELF